MLSAIIYLSKHGFDRVGHIAWIAIERDLNLDATHIIVAAQRPKVGRLHRQHARYLLYTSVNIGQLTVELFGLSLHENATGVSKQRDYTTKQTKQVETLVYSWILMINKNNLSEINKAMIMEQMGSAMCQLKNLMSSEDMITPTLPLLQNVYRLAYRLGFFRHKIVSSLENINFSMKNLKKIHQKCIYLRIW